MGLYWKELEIVPGMALEVDFFRQEVFSSKGGPVAITWKVLSFGNRKEHDTYLEYSSGKKYPLEKVIKKRKLQAKLERGELLQLPAGSDFIVIQEFYDGEKAHKRCYDMDLLQTIRNIKVITE